MRDFKGMKRQRGRNRGGGGGKPQHNANRAFESNGPEGVKVRGAAQAVFDRYQQLARDASSAGDRVLAENYLQHAEHYFRTLRAMQPQRPVAEIYGRDQYSSGFDIDFEAEPEESGAEATEHSGEEGGEGDERREQREDRQPRDRYENRDRDRQRDDRPRDDRPQRDRYENRDRQRDDRQRDDRPRDDRPRDDRPRDDRPRDDRPRDDRPRDDRPRDGEQRNGEGRRDRWRDREDRRRDEQPREPVAAEAPAAAPAEPASPMLRSQDGETSHAPAFLGRAAEPPAADEAPKPRRKRAPKAAAETEEA